MLPRIEELIPWMLGSRLARESDGLVGVEEYLKVGVHAW